MNQFVRYRPTQPVIAADKPWEEGASLRAISAIPEEDGRRHRLYYLVWRRIRPARNELCVAYSDDGLNWEKPDLGEGHNIVFRGSGNTPDWGVFFPQQVILDPSEENENLRWKMAYWGQPSKSGLAGLCLAGSNDGFEWTPISDYPIITNRNDGSCLITANRKSPILWMDCRYYIYQQTWKYNPSLPLERDNRTKMHRRISIWAADRFGTKWMGPVVVLEPDKDDHPDDQFYWLTVFHTKTGYGGFLQVHHTASQTEDLQFVTSEDGWEWKRRHDRQTILGTGAPGQFDSGMVFTISGPMRIGEKTYILYGGQSWVHDQTPRNPDVELIGPDAGIGIAEVDPVLLDMA